VTFADGGCLVVGPCGEGLDGPALADLAKGGREIRWVETRPAQVWLASDDDDR
jgi:hypothetical protein